MEKKKVFKGFWGFFFLYAFIIYMFMYWFFQYDKLIFAIIAGIIVVGAIVHACVFAWNVGKAERELEAKEEFVAQAELEEKYDYYKHKRTGKN